MLANIIVLCSVLGLSSGFHIISPIQRSRSMGLSMIMPIRSGSIVALVTPMTPTNGIDYATLETLLKWHVAEGTDGAVILGTTGEASTISMEERTEIIKTAVKVVNGAFPIIVGTGAIETEKVIALCEHAQSLGADASLIITPYYVKPPQRALITHFKRIASSVSLPVILYNCPGRTGVDMKPETISELSSHPNIIGVKDATGDLERVLLFRKGCGKEFLIFSGEDDSGCKFVSLGGDGVISVTANVAPGPMHTMLALAKEGKEKDALVINDMLMPLHERLFLESNPIPTKKVLQLMGKIGSGIRAPLCELADIHLENLKEAMTLGNLKF